MPVSICAICVTVSTVESELIRVQLTSIKAVKYGMGFLLVRVASMPPKHGHLGLRYGNKRCQSLSLIGFAMESRVKSMGLV